MLSACKLRVFCSFSALMEVPIPPPAMFSVVMDQPAPGPLTIQSTVQHAMPFHHAVPPAPPPTIMQPVVQPELTVIQSAPPPTIMHPVVQPELTVIQSAPPPTIMHPVVQPELTVIQSAPPPTIMHPVVQPELTVVQSAPPPTVIQSVVQPELTVVQSAPPPTIMHPVVQPDLTVVQSAPQPTIMQPVVQPELTVVQSAPQPTIIQPVVQPEVTMVHPLGQPPVTVLQPAPAPAVVQSAVQPAVVVDNSVVVQPLLRDAPGLMRCNVCQREVLTVIRYINGQHTWVVFGILCLFGYIRINVCIQYSGDSTKGSCPATDPTDDNPISSHANNNPGIKASNGDSIWCSVYCNPDCCSTGGYGSATGRDAASSSTCLYCSSAPGSAKSDPVCGSARSNDGLPSPNKWSGDTKVSKNDPDKFSIDVSGHCDNITLAGGTQKGIRQHGQILTRENRGTIKCDKKDSKNDPDKCSVDLSGHCDNITLAVSAPHLSSNNLFQLTCISPSTVCNSERSVPVMDDPLYEEVPDEIKIHTVIPEVQPAVTVVQPAPPLIQTELQQALTVVQPAPPPTVIQTELQQALTVVQPAPVPTVFQPNVQPMVTVVQPEPVPAVIQAAIPQTLTVVNQMVSKPNLRDLPGPTRCSYCQLDVITVTRYLTDTTVSCNLFGSHCAFSCESMQNISPPPYPGPPVGLQYPNCVQQVTTKQEAYMQNIRAQGASNANMQYLSNPNMYPEQAKQGMKNIPVPPYPGPPLGYQQPDCVKQGPITKQQEAYKQDISALGASNANMQYLSNPNMYPEQAKQGPPGSPLHYNSNSVQQGAYAQSGLLPHEAAVQSPQSSMKESFDISTQRIKYTQLSYESAAPPAQCAGVPPPPYPGSPLNVPNCAQQVSAGVLQQNITSVQHASPTVVMQQSPQPAIIQAPNAAVVQAPVFQVAAQPQIMFQQQVVMQSAALVQPQVVVQSVQQPRIIYQMPAANQVGEYSSWAVLGCCLITQSVSQHSQENQLGFLNKVIQPNLKETPGRMKCNYCHQDIVTIAKPINGVLTWTVFGVLLVFLIWPCCLIPFCVSSCKDIEHSCPYCHNVIHIYRRM
ncbi:hypothetical protein NFI96_016549 [Prochilodus magdalenae]|nr:hypothetical protein NFI96_016549 [Prochilodus magdalenae]